MLEERFDEIQSRLPALYARLKADPRGPRLAVAVPSLSLDTEGMSMPEGMVHYEERMLYLLNMLRHPHSSLAMCTSLPMPSSLIGYYLHFLPGVPYSHAHRRLKMFSADDWRDVPLTQKILERPVLLERLRRHVQGHSNAYLTCYQSSHLEMKLAVELGIPILGTDPRHLEFGSKSKARGLFAQAGIPVPPGRADLRTEREIAEAILELQGHGTVVIKQNHGVSGLGNARLPLEDVETTDGLEGVLRALPGQARCEVPWWQFLRRFQRTGGVVEAWIANATPVSVQLHTAPDGEVQLVGTHEEFYDSRGIYVGCRLPVREQLRPALHLAGLQMGRLLAAEGVTGRFDIDFLALPGQLLGVDVNLRKGNTTYPLRTLNLLAGGHYDPELGLYQTKGGTRAYVCTDKLTSPLFHGLVPEDLIDIATYQGLHYSTSSHTGAVFHMLGGLSRYGRVGVTCIGTDPEGARELYDKCLRGLEEQASGWEWL